MFPKEQEEVRSQIFFYPKCFGTNFFGDVVNFRFKNKHNFLGEPFKQKMSQIVEKVHNFLDPLPLNWTILIWEEKDIYWPPSTDIVANPFTLTKTVPKSYQTDAWG